MSVTVLLGEPVAAGHAQDVVRVPFSVRVRVWAIAPVCPVGHATDWVSLLALRVMATEVGEGATHAGAQVLDVVVQADHAPHVRTGAAQASGQA